MDQIFTVVSAEHVARYLNDVIDLIRVIIEKRI